MANITTATTAVMIAELWTKEVEKPFYDNLQFANLVQRRDGLVKGGGDTIHIPFLSLIDARDKAADTAVTYDSPTESEIQISIDKHKYIAFLIEDIAKVQSNYQLASLYRGAAAEGVARAIDSDLGGLYTGAGTTVASGGTVTDPDILTVVETLDAANAPRADRSGVVTSGFHTDLLAVDRYSVYDQTGMKGEAVTDGRVANVYGMGIYIDNNVANDGVLDHNLFFHKKAMTLAMQLSPTFKMEDSVDYIGMKAVLHSIYGVGIERAGLLVDVTL